MKIDNKKIIIFASVVTILVVLAVFLVILSATVIEKDNKEKNTTTKTVEEIKGIYPKDNNEKPLEVVGPSTTDKEGTEIYIYDDAKTDSEQKNKTEKDINREVNVKDDIR